MIFRCKEDTRICRERRSCHQSRCQERRFLGRFDLEYRALWQNLSSLGLLLGCVLVPVVPYLRKKFIEKTVEEFNYEYAITMLFSFIISTVASLMIYSGQGIPTGDHFNVFIEGMKLGLFDNFWVNEAKKFLYAGE